LTAYDIVSDHKDLEVEAYHPQRTSGNQSPHPVRLSNKSSKTKASANTEALVYIRNRSV
jgi:hypothetical protein